MVISGHAATIASVDERLCLPCAQSSRGADADFRQAAGFRGVRGSDRAGEGPFADAGFGVVRDAQSLAFRALAARRRRLVGVHALVVGDAYATLARGAPHGRHGPAVPGAFQVVSDPRRQPFVGRASLCGAKSATGQSGPRGGRLAMVEPLASRARQQGWALGRRPVGVAASLASTHRDAANRSGIGGVASFGGARRALRRSVVADTNGEATGPAIHVASARSPVAETTRIKIKTPDPFILLFAFLYSNTSKP